MTRNFFSTVAIRNPAHDPDVGYGSVRFTGAGGGGCSVVVASEMLVLFGMPITGITVKLGRQQRHMLLLLLLVEERRTHSLRHARNAPFRLAAAAGCVAATLQRGTVAITLGLSGAV